MYAEMRRRAKKLLLRESVGISEFFSVQSF